MWFLYRKLQAVSGALKLGSSESDPNGRYYREKVEGLDLTTLEELEQRVENGDANINTRLGLRYEIGEEVIQDFEEAAKR